MPCQGYLIQGILLRTFYLWYHVHDIGVFCQGYSIQRILLKHFNSGNPVKDTQLRISCQGYFTQDVKDATVLVLWGSVCVCVHVCVYVCMCVCLSVYVSVHV